MKLWQLSALIFALMAATPFAFMAIGTFTHPNPAKAVCAKTTDKDLIPMCKELEAG